jgi:quinol monooxygenase YgiN
MIGYALYARLEAKPQKVEAVAEFLAEALEMASRETTTPVWFALRLSDTTFGIFDAFASEADRKTHLSGPIGQALMARAEELFAAPPAIEFMEILGLKAPTLSND